jgi:hypothetical protein
LHVGPKKVCANLTNQAKQGKQANLDEPSKNENPRKVDQSGSKLNKLEVSIEVVSGRWLVVRNRITSHMPHTTKTLAPWQNVGPLVQNSGKSM